MWLGGRLRPLLDTRSISKKAIYANIILLLMTEGNNLKHSLSPWLCYAFRRTAFNVYTEIFPQSRVQRSTETGNQTNRRCWNTFLLFSNQVSGSWTIYSQPWIRVHWKEAERHGGMYGNSRVVRWWHFVRSGFPISDHARYRRGGFRIPGDRDPGGHMEKILRTFPEGTPYLFLARSQWWLTSSYPFRVRCFRGC